MCNTTEEKTHIIVKEDPEDFLEAVKELVAKNVSDKNRTLILLDIHPDEINECPVVALNPIIFEPNGKPTSCKCVELKDVKPMTLVSYEGSPIVNKFCWTDIHGRLHCYPPPPP